MQLMEETLKTSNQRAEKFIQLHQKELAELEQQLRIFQKIKHDRIEALNNEHESWLRSKEAEINRIQAEVNRAEKFHMVKCEEIANEFKEVEDNLHTRRNAAKAYLEQARSLQPLDVNMQETAEPSTRALSLLISREEAKAA